ncbi:MAG: YqgE/AlgH family protein [Actinomycetota bacterium]
MSTRGRHLVASPVLTDPNFAFTVVYMLEHGDEGALGVVLSRPSELPAKEMFDRWAEHASTPAMIYRGGPVALSSVIALGVASDDRLTDGFNPISAGIGTIDLDTDPGDLVALQGVRLFAGYASWAPGQLDAELFDDAWFVVDAAESDLLDPDPTQLWWGVLGRQAGELRLLANYPEEPWVN